MYISCVIFISVVIGVTFFLVKKQNHPKLKIKIIYYRFFFLAGINLCIELDSEIYESDAEICSVFPSINISFRVILMYAKLIIVLLGIFITVSR